MMIGECAIEEIMDTKKRSLKSGACTMEPAKENDIVSPPAKRLKQGRLPFKPLTSPKQVTLPSSPSHQLVKKGKNSVTPSRSVSKPKQLEKKTTPLKKGDTPHSKKQAPGKGKRISFSAENAPKTSKQYEAVAANLETAVSSSSEDMKVSEKVCDSTVACKQDCDSSASAKKTPKTASLDGFLQTTQQPQVSTSDIVDLTCDADDEMEEVGEEPVVSASSGSVDRDDAQPISLEGETREETASAEEKGDVSINTSMSSAISLGQISSSEDEESSDEDDEEEEEDDDDSNTGDGEKPTAEKQTLSPTKQSADDKVQVKEAKTTSTVDTQGTQNSSSLLKPGKKKTTKALDREREAQRKREEKARQREEKKRKLEEERETKKRQRLEQRSHKELEREALRQQKADEKRKKMEEKERKKELEEQERLEKKKAKEAERLKREQEVEAKQEEKRKKQEEKLKIEEEKKQKEAAVLLKKEKQSLMFKSFFKVQAPAPVKKTEVTGRFAPFEVKEDMVLAPCLRVDSKQIDFTPLEDALTSQADSPLYLEQLKSKDYKRGKAQRTPWPQQLTEETMEVDVQPSEEPSKKKPKIKKPDHLKMKLLKFHENYRPAYYGTWQKETSAITGRNPFKKDEDVFDYEFDSDDEWEEPGESLSHSEGEDDDGEGSGDDDEDEDGFFVPHGYLSAGEGGDDEEDSDKLKARQAAKARAWDNELKRRCEALKPIIITLLDVAATSKAREAERKKLEAYRAVPLGDAVPIPTSFSIKRDKACEENSQLGIGKVCGSSNYQRIVGGVRNKLKPVPDEAMPDLLRMVHGNMAGIKSLIREFRDHWRREQHHANRPGSATPTPAPESTSPTVSGQTSSPAAGSPVGTTSPSVGQSPSPDPSSVGPASPQNLEHVAHLISKRQLDLKINSIAKREKRPEFNRICWYVHQHVLEEYKLMDLPVPTQWVNGVGVRDGTASPLPPRSITVTPVAATSKPTVNKPTVAMKQPNPNTVSSLLTASRQSNPAAAGNPHIAIPSSSLHSAFNKVGAFPSASSAVHLHPNPNSLPGAPFIQPISYLSPGGTILQAGLTPLQVVPIQMQQTLAQGPFHMSSLLQQAAASSIMANINARSMNNPATTKATSKTSPVVATPRNMQVMECAPSSKAAEVKLADNLPTKPKVSPKRLDASIAKLYESGKLLSPVSQEKSKPVKKTATLTSFFSVKTTKQSSSEVPGQEPDPTTSKE
ncbi:uncharacterized protein [Diadema antillarum]|uniref:uncharacterized protein n=1 Tax=Diadema antillarum TaxID=105358 RepID=UPI003A843C2E